MVSRFIELTRRVNSRVMFSLISARKASTPPSFTLNNLAKLSFTSGNDPCITFCTVTWKRASFPDKSAWLYSAGKVKSKSFSLPAFSPIKPSSKPGIIDSEPIMTSNPSALPPSKGTSFKKPSKSRITLSPFLAALAISFHSLCFSRKVSIVLSTSSSCTSEETNSIFCPSSSLISKIGNTSKIAWYSKASPGAICWGSIAGGATGVNSCSRKALYKLVWINSWATSFITEYA